MTAALKYCGGCNPRYDRSAAARRLAEAAGLPFLAPARPGETCGTLVVLCGCSARCADISALAAEEVLWICSEADTAAAAARLAAMKQDA